MKIVKLFIKSWQNAKKLSDIIPTPHSSYSSVIPHQSNDLCIMNGEVLIFASRIHFINCDLSIKFNGS